MEREYFFSIYDLRAALESFEDCLLDSMGYGYNCCYCNGLDELMIPPLLSCSGLFRCVTGLFFCIVSFVLGLLPPPFLCFALLMIYECHELPSYDPMPCRVLRL